MMVMCYLDYHGIISKKKNPIIGMRKRVFITVITNDRIFMHSSIWVALDLKCVRTQLDYSMYY